MQLKFNRSSYQKKGLFGSKTIYKLEALADFSPEEEAFIKSQSISLQLAALGEGFDDKKHLDFWAGNERKSMSYAVLGPFLAIRLLNGLTIETENQEEIQVAESGIVAALKLIQAHVKTKSTFDGGGSERIIEL